MEARISSLERQLIGAKIIIEDALKAKTPGYLEDLQRKAQAYEAASTIVAAKDKEIDKLKQELTETKKANARMESCINELTAATNSMSIRIVELESKNKPLKEALDFVRKGKFEYYQIKEGDTFESIAAQSAIYNDKSKSVLIRQANRGGVVDPDKLVPGEVLVIPRFPLGVSYEF